ncbi:MAG: response regulator, partial [Phycisphaerae bacterium]|nr:response regulator [Phycisphaerae bacterium]
MATSDQIHRLDSPEAELIAVFKRELRSVLSDQAELTIMCVDDDEVFLRSLKSFLPEQLRNASLRFALNFEFFADPVDALEEVRRIPCGRLAVVISDQVMPKMDGVELLQEIRHLSPDTLCVLLTAHAALDSAVRGINEQTLDKYFFKPIEETVDFINDISHLLNEFHLRRQSDAQRQRLIAQFEFMQCISAAQDMDTALAATIDFFDEQIHPRGVIIASKGEKGYIIRAGTGLPPDMPVGATVGEGSVFEWVLRRCGPVLVDSDDQLPADIALPSFISPPLAVLPITWGNTPRGAILLTGRRRFTHIERILMNFIADVISPTVSGFEDRRALEEHYVGTMTSLVAVIEAKDSYARGHTDRVTELTVSLAEAVGIMDGKLEDIRRAAALHDIGKLAVPDEIITKPAKLNDEEYAE